MNPKVRAQMIDPDRFPMVESHALGLAGSCLSTYEDTLSGFQVSVLDRPGEDSFVGVSLRTLPSDNRGLPHVTEHCVLRQSLRHGDSDLPTLLYGSRLARAFNGLVFRDKTIIYATSEDPALVAEQLRLMLDFLLFPALTEQVLLDERGSIRTVDAVRRAKGVIPNELIPEQYQTDRLLRKIAFGHVFDEPAPYAFDAGGTLDDINDIELSDVLQFHNTFYRPQCLRVFAVGQVDANQINSIVATYADEVGYERDSGSKLPAFPVRPREEVPAITIHDPHERIYGIVSFLGPTLSHYTQVLAAELQTECLLGARSSPLRAALHDVIENDIHGISGFDSELYQTVGSIVWVCADVDTFETHRDSAIALIRNHFGRSPKHSDLAAAVALARFHSLHDFDFERFCIGVFRKILRSWNWGSLPGLALPSDRQILDVESSYRHPTIDEDSIRVCLVRGRKDADFVQPDNPAEQQPYRDPHALRLSRIGSSHYKRWIKDFSATAVRRSYASGNVCTNGICYIDMFFSIGTKAELALLFRLAEHFNKITDSPSLAIRKRRLVPHLTLSIECGQSPDASRARPFFCVSLRTLSENAIDALKFVIESLDRGERASPRSAESARVDAAANLFRGVLRNPGHFARLIAEAERSPAKRAEELATGPSQMKALLSIEPDDRLPGLYRTLRGSLCHARVSADDEAVQSAVENLIADAFGVRSPGHGIAMPPTDNMSAILLVSPYPSNAVAHTMLVRGFPSHESAVAQVVSRIVTAEYLWPLIRTHATGYGAVCRYDKVLGLVTAYAEKTPRITSVSDIVSRWPIWVATRGIDRHQLEYLSQSLSQICERHAQSRSQFCQFARYHDEVFGVHQSDYMEQAKFLRSLTVRSIQAQCEAWAESSQAQVVYVDQISNADIVRRHEKAVVKTIRIGSKGELVRA